MLQGEFRLDARSLLLVFQVNCPACFTYALPLAEAIHRASDRLGLSVLALSTAFEDFDLNTAEHTRALLEERRLVGETRRALGTDTFEGELTFPFAVDAGIERGIGETFVANQLRGTPSWLVIEPDGAILSHHFGQLPIRYRTDDESGSSPPTR